MIFSQKLRLKLNQNLSKWTLAPIVSMITPYLFSCYLYPFGASIKLSLRCVCCFSNYYYWNEVSVLCVCVCVFVNMNRELLQWLVLTKPKHEQQDVSDWCSQTKVSAPQFLKVSLVPEAGFTSPTSTHPWIHISFHNLLNPFLVVLTIKTLPSVFSVLSTDQ